MQETSSATILNVDDDEPGRYAVTRLLRQAGYAVAEAATGGEALRLAAALPPDLVVLDVHLPDLSGLEVCRRLKADPATALIPILHLSATSIDSDNIAAGLEAGADAYLVEPVEAQVLVAQVRTLLRMRRLYQELAQAREEAEQQAQQLGVTLEELQVATEELEVANEGLRENEERYRSLAENVPCVLMRYDRELRVTYLSPSAEEVTGLPVAQFIGRTNRDVGMPEALCDLWESALEEVFRTGAVREVEFDFPAAGGARTFYLRLAPQRGADGSILHVLGVSAEITARKQAEEALRESEERYRDLVEGSNSIIMQADRDLNITYMNEFGLRFFGYAAAEVLGKNVIGTTIPQRDSAGRDLAAMAREIAQAPERYRVNVHQNMRKNGELVWVSWTNRVQYDQDGQLASILAIGNDVSQLKRAEEERERLQADLLAAERARAELAEHLNREISHRTKNNLAMVAGLLQMQVSESRNQEVTAALRDATARVLTFASIHEQLQAGSGEEADVLDLVRRIAHATASTFALRGVAVSVEGAPVVCPRGMATNLAVMANELLTNAIKHGAPGPTGELQVKARVEPAGDQVRLAVWSSGNPVSPDFDPAQARGLGLRLVQALAVEQYGGAFSLRPHDGGSLAEVSVAHETLRRGAE